MTIEQLKDYLNSEEKIIIELGCGPNKKLKSIGIDALDLPGVDIVANLEEGLTFLPDSSVDEIYSTHFLEHTENFAFLMDEIYRVLKPGGLKIAIVPHFSNPYYYSDYTHKRFFGLYTFDYFSTRENQLKRKVPTFYNSRKFIIHERKLIFKSPFTIRNLFKQVLNKVFNLSNFWKEFYEENFCYIFPCQEVKFIISPIKD